MTDSSDVIPSAFDQQESTTIPHQNQQIVVGDNNSANAALSSVGKKSHQLMLTVNGVKDYKWLTLSESHQGMVAINAPVLTHYIS